MGRALTLKLGMIGLLILILLIVIELISGTVNDRQHYLNTAKQKVTQSWTGPQEILGPVLRVPYRIEYPATSLNQRAKPQFESHVLYIAPKTLLSRAVVRTEERQKGIFTIPVFETEIFLEGLFEFDLSSNAPGLSPGHATKEGDIRFGTPTLGIGIRDARGITQVNQLQWGANQLDFSPGSKLKYLHQGLHAEVNINEETPFEITFSSKFSLRGMDQILFQPAARTFQLELDANWPDPSFVGSFLPRKHSILENSFKAEWLTHEFSSSAHASLSDCASQECPLSTLDAIGVEFIQPVDIYAKSERSLKYAILFVTLVFATFFVIETIKRLPIHPIQYGLVGLAICTFYLLLVSASEHVAFGIAYGISAMVCISLVTVYLSAVLNSHLAAGVFAGWLGVIYGLLYVIVNAEDFALIMGSLLVFAVLAVLMITTRKIDWYALEIELKPSPPLERS